MKETLLLTACIKPNTNISLAITDTRVRLKSYLDALNFWITQSNFDNIVFCENSKYPHNYKPLEDLAKLHKKNLETIIFSGDNKVASKYGKGFAEGEIINYALQASTILKNTRTFYKVTGRVVVENINKIIEKHKDIETAFISTSPGAKSADTRFFKTSTSFYRRELCNIYKGVRDSEGIYLEKIFYKHLIKCRIQSFNHYPVIKGPSGSTGEAYDKSKFGVALRELLVKLGRYKLKP